MAAGCLASPPTTGVASPTDPDPTFDGDGVLVVDIHPGITMAATDTADRLTLWHLASHVSESGDLAAVVRVLPDGSFDRALGDGGVVWTKFVNRPGMAADGALVEVELIDGPRRAQVTRYEASGALDQSFGQGGRATVELAGGDAPQGAAIAPDGKVLVTGTSWSVEEQQRLFLIRLHPNGELDTNFGANGRAAGPVWVDRNYGGDELALDPQGRALIGSSGCVWGPRSAGCQYLHVAAFTASGSLDPGFGEEGEVWTSVGPQGLIGCSICGYRRADLVSLVSQPDGKIVAAGTGPEPVVRYLPDGSLDGGFGVGGKLPPGRGPLGSAGGGAVVDPAGRLLVLGGACLPRRSGCESTLTLVRYTQSGEVDTAFGDCGALYLPEFGGGPARLATYQDGRIAVAGAEPVPEDEGFRPRLRVVRLLGGDAAPAASPSCREISLTTRVSAERVSVGRRVTAAVTVRNEGVRSADAVRVTLASDPVWDDAVLAELVEAIEGGACKTKPPGLECAVGTLEPGESRTLTFAFRSTRPDDRAPGRFAVLSAHTETDYADNQASITLETFTLPGRCANLFDGTARNERLVSGAEGARMVGGRGNDTLFGRAGQDCLHGGRGDDRLSGGPGADDLRGGAGHDRLLGGAGNDRLFARDGERDTVRCGSGDDRVRADRRDRLISCPH